MGISPKGVGDLASCFPGLPGTASKPFVEPFGLPILGLCPFFVVAIRFDRRTCLVEPSDSDVVTSSESKAVTRPAVEGDRVSGIAEEFEVRRTDSKKSKKN
jgi:hypothetical protein